MIIAFVKSHICNRKFSGNALSIRALNHSTQETVDRIREYEKTNEATEKIILGLDLVSDNIVSLIQLTNQINSAYCNLKLCNPELKSLARQAMLSFANEFARFEGQLLLVQDIAPEIWQFSQRFLSVCKVTYDNIFNY